MISNQNNNPEWKDQKDQRVYPMRLQRFLARSGVASRRGSEDLMTAGRVSVNGVVVTELGTKVDPLKDTVCVDGKLVCFHDDSVTLMLYKPSGYLTTMSDPYGRPTVAELVPINQYPGLFPIGRLDYDTTGLLLFSTDGNLGHSLLRPKSHVSKSYYALVEGKVDKPALRKLREGVPLDGVMTLPAQVSVLQGDERDYALSLLYSNSPLIQQDLRAKQLTSNKDSFSTSNYSALKITLHEGKKRQIKRMCEAVGHSVLALHRFAFASLTLQGLKPGKWCMLEPEQINALSNMSS